MWWLRWWCCCCCSGLKISWSCAWDQARWRWNKFHLRRNTVFVLTAVEKLRLWPQSTLKVWKWETRWWINPGLLKGGGGSTGATESLVLSNHELTAKISHLHFYKTCCQQQLPHSELTPQANENSFRAKTFTLTCYQWVPTQWSLCLCLTQARL